MCLIVHMRGTTGQDAAARRAHAYAERCTQCGVALTPTTRVAAHVRVYGPLCCCGTPTLRTTCKRCNARHKPHWTVRLRRWPTRLVPKKKT